MLDLDVKLNEFVSNIKLSDAKKNDLIRGRNAIRAKIKSSFQESDKNQPKFRMQGSFTMGTMIQAMTDVEYDLDDGVYLQNFNEIKKEDWGTPDEVHNDVFSIIKEHTDNVINKKTCVRVIYSKNYHVDLPIYIVRDDVAFLAHLDKGWIESDPKALKEWFIGKVNANSEDLRTIVKILKAWKDNLNKNEEVVNLCGLAITILVANNYIENTSIVSSVLQTVTEIISKLSINFVCYKPVNPKNEDIFSTLSNEEKDAILRELRKFKIELDKARNAENEKKGCEVLISLLGSRFPVGLESIKNDNAIRTEAPAIIEQDERSA